MANWAILATGESMSPKVVHSVRHHSRVIVVSDAFRLAPWAWGLVSQDRTWWKENSDAIDFEGRKFSLSEIDGVERFEAYKLIGDMSINSATNSGLLACCVAQWMGATQIELYGFDMRGSHYFGPHREPLKNTKPERFLKMIDQFRNWDRKNIEVINMTPNSALTCFPMGV